MKDDKLTRKEIERFMRHKKETRAKCSPAMDPTRTEDILPF
jgi:hypothetical protein